jgi:hypothetical protein
MHKTNQIVIEFYKEANTLMYECNSILANTDITIIMYMTSYLCIFMCDLIDSHKIVVFTQYCDNYHRSSLLLDNELRINHHCQRDDCVMSK